MLDRLDETIVAVSSAPGNGSVGVVRLSGTRAIDIVDRMAESLDGKALRSRDGSTHTSGALRVDETTTVPARFYVFCAPHSYTRDDMVEVMTVGAPPILELVRQRAIELGAVAAEPGEFTARAFLSGRIDLTAAESVARIIRAESDAQLRAARRMMDGALNAHVRAARDELADLLALVEADIDFSEEPIDFITPRSLRDRLAPVTDRLRTLLADASKARRFDMFPRILLFGPPNAGKSTLMNRLSGTSRAICAAVAGTTRDVLSAPVRLGRAEAVLLDAAGIDRSERSLDAQARTMTLSEAERVDLICVVIDVTAAPDDHLCGLLRAMDVARCVVAANKCDLVGDHEVGALVERLSRSLPGPVCAVSAADGTGVDALRAALAEALGDWTESVSGNATPVNERQRGAIQTAVDSLGRAASLADGARETIDCADLLAFELREALDALGAVTGEVATDDLLRRVFAEFCIGK